MDSNDERLEVGALSETGYTREENQDRMSGARVPLGHLYIVADGMGGHKGGALAAQMAVEELQRYIGHAAAGESANAVIEGAFKAANDAVYKRSNSGDTAVAGMGTTAVLALILGRVAKLAHVGDSRAYLFRNHRLAQLTTDHTIVQRMIEAGMLRPDEAADHPQSSVLERAIGSAPTVGVDIRDHQLEEGDALLLCSDGLSGYVGADKIEAVLRSDGPVQDTTLNLVRLALEAGGRDNVTVQLIRYGARGLPAPAMRTRPLPTLPPPAPAAGAGPVRREPGSLLKLAVFAVAGTLAGTVTAGSLVYSLGNRTTPAVSELTQKLNESNAARDQAQQRVKELVQQVEDLQRRPVLPPPSPASLAPPPPAPSKVKEARKTTPPGNTNSKKQSGDSTPTKSGADSPGKRPEDLSGSDKGTPGTDKGVTSVSVDAPPSTPPQATAPKDTVEENRPTGQTPPKNTVEEGRPTDQTPAKDTVEEGRPTGQTPPEPAPSR